MKYQFIGEYPEVFIDLGRELQPEETFDSDKALVHPRLKEVEVKQQQKKAEVVE